MRLLSLTLALFFLIGASAQAAHIVHGKITTDAGAPAAGVNVVLIEQNPNKAPAGPLAMAQTQPDGSYELTLEAVDSSSQYVVGTRLGQTRAASQPFSFDGQTAEVNVTVAASPVNAAATEDLLEGKFRFEGRLNAEAGFSVAGAKLSLVEMTISQPDGRVVAQADAKADGSFSLLLPQAHKHSLYFVVAGLGARSASSQPKPLRPGVYKVQMDLAFLPVSHDPAQLQVVKNLFFFELLEEMVRVSEIILVENQFAGTLDLSEKPFSKELPQGAENFALMRSDEGVKAAAVGNKAFISLAMEPGRGQIFYSYELKRSELGGPMTAGILPGTREVELVRTSEGFDVSFLGALASNVLETKQGHGQEAFFSKKTILPASTSQVEFEVDVNLIPQKRLFYPATLLLVLLLSALFWYVKIKPEKAA
ncbi:MAG: carboxypeptidase-like regulatory domain-containing protein [bacterium]|nr:carboxypeptidase-like regulatory domain-containing protein [bacterium]